MSSVNTLRVHSANFYKPLLVSVDPLATPCTAMLWGDPIPLPPSLDSALKGWELVCLSVPDRLLFLSGGQPESTSRFRPLHNTHERGSGMICSLGYRQETHSRVLLVCDKHMTYKTYVTYKKHFFSISRFPAGIHD